MLASDAYGFARQIQKIAGECGRGLDFWGAYDLLKEFELNDSLYELKREIAGKVKYADL